MRIFPLWVWSRNEHTRPCLSVVYGGKVVGVLRWAPADGCNKRPPKLVVAEQVVYGRLHGVGVGLCRCHVRALPQPLGCVQDERVARELAVCPLLRPGAS